MPPLADRFAHELDAGFLLVAAGRRRELARGHGRRTADGGDGTQAFRLRLTPPLAAVPDAAEVVVTGPATRVRATVPIRPAPATGDDDT